MSHELSSYARPQVRAVLHHESRIYIACEIGLYELQANRLVPVERWREQPVQGLASGFGRQLLLIENDQGQTLHECDAEWSSTRVLPAIAGEKIKSLGLDAEGVLAGTKSGLFRWADERWQRLFSDVHGKGEVLWVRGGAGGQPLRASVKKLGHAARPALIESGDGGLSWAVSAQPDYQDLVLAADDQWIVTRWRGARRRGSEGEIKKHPLSAAQIGGDGWTVLDGDKLESQRIGYASSSFYHPIVAEAEHLLRLDDACVLVAGVQGAWLLDVATGRSVDLFEGMALPQGLGKIKRVFVLDDGALLATATFGTFRSTDGGIGWVPCNSEWSVLDAEHLLKGPDGRWWLGCQRALFVSDDNGLTWRYIKLKVKHPHYAELRGGLAIVGDRLYVGTKAGLLSSTLQRPESVTWVSGYERLGIEALHADPGNDALLVGTDDGTLWLHEVASGAVRRVAEVPVYESTLFGVGDHCLVTTGAQLFEIERGRVREITPADAQGELSLVALDATRFLLWDRDRGWSGEMTGPMTGLPDWPAQVRHASVAASARVVHTTDRRKLRVVPIGAR